MAKKIILSLDGTLDSPGGDPSHVQAIQTLILHENALPEITRNDKQGWSIVKYPNTVFYYDAGLGAKKTNWYGKTNGYTSSVVFSESLCDKFERIQQAALGIGITQNVAQAYHALATHYEKGGIDNNGEKQPDDQVYGFGFSRGAYTLLLLVAMIRYIGLINIHSDAFKKKYGNDIHKAIDDGFACYNSKIHPDENRAAKAFKDAYCHDGKHLIHFLGLLEPVKGLVIETLHAGNHISSVPKFVSIAYSINEKRALYQPSIYIPSEESSVISAWMPGSHSDTGGSRNAGLANISLHWIMEEAMRCGLEVNTKLLDNNHPQNPLAEQYNSMADEVPFTSLHWRDISPKQIREIPVNTHPGHTLHPSTYLRYGQQVLGETKYGKSKTMTYQPKNVLSAIEKINSTTDNSSYALIYNYRHGYPVPKTLPLTIQDKQKEAQKETALIACQGKRRLNQQ